MNKKYAVLLAFCALLTVFSPNLFADTSSSTTAVPYSDDEFPQWAKDLRRTEIITLGSLPFATLAVMLGYGTYLYTTGQTTTFPNPLNKSSDAYTSDQQLQIFTISLSVSAILGLTDLTINLINRANNNNRIRMIEEETGVTTVTPLTPEEASQMLLRNSEVIDEGDKVSDFAENTDENGAETEESEDFDGEQSDNLE